MEKAASMSIDTSIFHLNGTAREVGISMGKSLGDRLAQSISLYLQKRPSDPNGLDMEKLTSAAIPWLRSLPERFQHEFEGLAEGANIPLQHIAEWAYVDEYLDGGCSAFICFLEGHAWVGRNNDFYVPELWGTLTIREVENRIPTISFGLLGDVFTPTGINKERLWLHYNFLPVSDSPQPDKPHFPGYVLLTEALETCSTIHEVEDLLKRYDRDGGMMLFAVDGKTDEFAIFECSCAQYFKRAPVGKWLLGTNHYCSHHIDANSSSSEIRYGRMEELINTLFAFPAQVNLPVDLIAILADSQVEAREENFGTVCANVACPGTGQVWHTFGGFPAASKGNWHQIDWPWE